MNDLVFKGANDLVLTNSLLVAEKFGKEHRHVLDAIRDLIKGCAENSAVPMFEETTYINPQNKQEYPMFIMNRDGFTLLAMGFTGKKALNFKMDFINAFNKMETMLRSDDYILMRSQQILQKRVEMAEQKVRALEEKNALQDAQLRQAAPKVKYVDEVLQSVNTYTSTQIAKEIGMDAAKFHKALKERKVIECQYLHVHADSQRDRHGRGEVPQGTQRNIFENFSVFLWGMEKYS
ncbi:MULTISPECIES: Rha family transcriptional regulator [Bacteroidales]|uniref:Rha family transcriptional regulator n=1 Tax=Bacteroidales TaxID=171549 RepID=UPI0025991778|nr:MULTISPECIES: Rha family transcriptional regulator [Bacteroidales]